MRYLVTGAAGFIGSHTVDRLLADGHEVIGIDSYITGQRPFVADALASPRFQLIEADLFDLTTVVEACEGVDAIFHLAANTDIRYGTDHPRRDLDQNVIVTWNILEAMRRKEVKTILFASTAAVYGDAARIPTPEDCPLPIQTSLYGASKLAAEGFISAYAAGYGMRALIFRFVSVLGERYTHGHVMDICRQLKEHPEYVRLSRQGSARRSYVAVRDCVDAMFLALERTQETVGVFNVGFPDHCQLADTVAWIADQLCVHPAVEFDGRGPAWAGDSPFIFLDCWKLISLGWQPKVGIEEAVRLTVDHISANPWLLDHGE